MARDSYGTRHGTRRGRFAGHRSATGGLVEAADHGTDDAAGDTSAPAAALNAAAARLGHWGFVPNGSEGFAKAEVTAGGISTAELSSQTMEARKVPGLYAIGEAVDVTGWLGGYNFQWAWSSGWAAGQVA